MARCQLNHAWVDCTCGPAIGTKTQGRRLVAAGIGATVFFGVAVLVLNGLGLLP